jgi:predicted nucleic acid-binding Zn ribbon protein
VLLLIGNLVNEMSRRMIPKGQKRKCVQCKKEFVAKWTGNRTCSDKCRDKYASRAK